MLWCDDDSKLFDASVIFEEIPIKVHNSHLVHAFLYELREQKSMRCDFDRLSISASPFLEQNLDSLGHYIEELGSEQGKFAYHQRQLVRQKHAQNAYLNRLNEEKEKRAAAGKEPLPEEDLTKHPLWKPTPKPSHLESFLVLNKLGLHCQQITSTAMLALNKMYVIDAISGGGGSGTGSGTGSAPVSATGTTGGSGGSQAKTDK